MKSTAFSWNFGGARVIGLGFEMVAQLKVPAWDPAALNAPSTGLQITYRGVATGGFSMMN